jgi:beta-phosphoglucomutase-like phosphatase (HAD superfamily)
MTIGTRTPNVARQAQLWSWSDPTADDELDELSASWRAALDSAQTAVAAAGAVLSAEALRGRAAELRTERVAAGDALESLAHDRHVDGWFSDLQVPSWHVRRLLGLPDDSLACVFNSDGVLVGSAAVHASAWGQTFDEFLTRRVERTHGRFAPFDLRTDYYEHIHGRPRLEGVRTFLASRGIRLREGDPRDLAGSETVNGLANRKQDVLSRLLGERRLHAFTGARRYLRLAHDVGLKIGIVSASTHSGAILALSGLAELVDESIDGEAMVSEKLRSKPAPDALLAACKRLGVQPERAVAFETTAAGVEAGRSAQFELVVAIAEPATQDLLRRRGAGAAASSLRELLEQRLASAR